MKYALLLLAMVGAVCGVELGWNVMGVTTIGDPCSAADEEVFYEECVEDVAVTMGVDLSHRRLELRGNRDLQQSSTCSTCCQKCGGECGCYPRGTWCFTKCSKRSRRLILTDEQAHSAWFLVATSQIQQAVNKCLHSKIEEGYSCLGNPEDLTIKLFLTE